LVDEGNATARIFGAIRAFMVAGLIPFAVSLGINMFIVIERTAHAIAAAMAALAITAIALWFWFGVELVALRNKGGKVMKTQDENVPLPQKIDQMLTEARVILPGAQALLAFQLAVVLTQSFDKLPSSSKAVHAMAFGLAALCTILLMAPAAHHRIVYNGEESQEFLTLGSRFLLAATIALALGLSAEVYVVITKIAGSSTVGLAATAASLIVLLGLWHISPVVLRAQATHPFFNQEHRLLLWRGFRR
jgi:hypothetical protein